VDVDVDESRSTFSNVLRCRQVFNLPIFRCFEIEIPPAARLIRRIPTL